MPLMTLPLRLLAAACAATLLLSDPARCVVARGGAQQQQVLQEHLLSQNQVADDNVEYPPDCAQRLNESSLALTSPTLLCVPQSDLPRAGEINCTQWYSQKMPDGVTFYKTPTSVIRTFLYAQRCDAGDAGEFACVQDFDNATLTSASSDCANSLNNVNLRDGAVKTEINYKTELSTLRWPYVRDAVSEAEPLTHNYTDRVRAAQLHSSVRESDSGEDGLHDRWSPGIRAGRRNACAVLVLDPG